MRRHPYPAAAHRALLLLAFLLLFPGAGVRAELEPFSTLTAPPAGWGAPHAAFGQAVAVKGDMAIVADSLSSAALHVFKRVDGQWVRQPHMGIVVGGSIHALDFDGQSLIVGGRSAEATPRGTVHILRLDPATERWTHEYGTVSNGSWGHSVAIDGDYAAIGVPTPAPGAVRPLRYNSATGWSSLPLLDPGTNAVAFGTSVSLRASRLAVGDPSAGFTSGRVRLWQFVSQDWLFRQQLSRPDGVLVGARFGHAVALHGEFVPGGNRHRLLIGAPGDRTDSGPNGMGRAYLYLRPISTTTFSLIDQRALTTPAANDHFGQAVALDGAYALIGVPGRSVNSHAEHGLVHGLLVSDTGFYGALTLLTDPQGMPGDRLGTKLAVSATGEGPRWVIGSPLADANANPGQGIALMGSGTLAAPFPTTWTRVDLGQGNHDARFGNSFSAHGGSLVVGSPFQSIDSQLRRGAVYVSPDPAANPGGVPAQQRILAPDGVAEDMFGLAVAHSDNVLVVGAPVRDEQGVYNAGSVYVYRRAPDGSWAFDAKLVDADIQSGGQFGGSVAVLDDDSVLVVSNLPARLSRYLRVGAGSWTRIETVPALALYGLAARVVVQGSRVVFAEPIYSLGGEGYQGAVRVFERVGDTLAGPVLQVIGTQPGQWLGASVAIDGDRLGVLSPGGDGSLDKGLVQTFRQLGPALWQPESSFPVQPLVRPQGFLGLSSISLQGDDLAVGSTTHQGAPEVRGGVFTYRFNGNGWLHRQTFTASQAYIAQTQSAFAGQVAWMGNLLFVGAPTVDRTFEKQGAVYVLRAAGDRIFAHGFE